MRLNTPRATPFPEVVYCKRDPSLIRASRCLDEMVHRSLRAHPLPARISLGIIESAAPWAGILTEAGPRSRFNMFLTRGLVEGLSNEEMIAVMGHEWAHVVDRRPLATWAFRGTAAMGSLGLHLLTVVLCLNGVGMGWPLAAAVLVGTLAMMFLFLNLEARALRYQELVCDRFAARLVGPRMMVSTLRRVEAIMESHYGKPRPTRKGWQGQADTHPKVGARVLHIARHRHWLRLAFRGS